MDYITIYSRENPMPRDRFAELYKIMEYSFPPEERGSESLHYSEFSRPKFRCLCCEPNEIAGFMNYYDFGSLVFLEHFAVAKELRGNGIGSRLIEELKRVCGGRRIVLEVEPPEQGDMAQSRVEFYSRHGFFMNEYLYYQPAFGDNEKPVRLKLMTYPEPLAEREFLDVRAVLYRDAYRLAEGHELFGQ